MSKPPAPPQPLATASGKGVGSLFRRCRCGLRQRYQLGFAVSRPEGIDEKDSRPLFSVNADGAAEPLSVQAAVMLPAQLLQPGEVIVLLLKPSPLFIVLAPLRTITVILLAVLLLGQLQARGINLGLSHADLVLAGAGLIGARLFWQVLEWLNQIYVLTDQRVIRVRGVLNVRVFECPLKNIQQTDLLLPLLQRLFGLGTIGFATAGTAFHEAYWLMLSKPLDVHQKIVETLRRYRR